MIICLKTCSIKSEPQHAVINLTSRLPKHILSDCTLNCDYLVRQYPNYYTLTLDVDGILPIQCLRCMESFSFPYKNHTEIAVCSDDETAAQLMNQYECIVGAHQSVDLVEVLTDELHLYAPEMHIEDCF